MKPFRGNTRMVALCEFKPYYFRDNIEKCVSPPFDSISGPVESELKSFPFNITHLTLPEGESKGSVLISQWIDLGILKRNEEAGMILIRQQTVIRGSMLDRYGIISLVDINPEDGLVQPHEKTFPSKVSERVKVLKDADAQLEPIFLAVNNELFDQKLRSLSSKLQPWLKFTDTEGVKYEISFIPLNESQDISGILMKDVAIVADGHHRLAASKQIARSSNEVSSAFWSSIMAYTTSMNSDSLLVDGIHRVLKCKIEEDKLAKLKSVCRVLPEDATNLQEEDIIILSQGEKLAIDREKADRRELSAISDIHLLEGSLLRDILGLSEEDLDKMIYYTHDLGECKRLVNSGQASMAFIMPPWKKDRLYSLILDIGYLPQKSTYFFPKVCSGIVMNINRTI